MRQILNDRKNTSFVNSDSVISMDDAITNLHRYAKQFSYPYLVLTGEFDDVVSNEKIVKWHSKTPESLPDK